MPDQQQHSTAGARRVLVDLTDREQAALEAIADHRWQSLESTVSDLMGEAIAEQVRRVTGQARLSASVVQFHKRQRARGQGET